MKITLYMATSADGFIAKSDGDSDWVSAVDNKNFEIEIRNHGCVIVGRRTFEQYFGSIYPIEGVMNFVVTTNQSLQSNDPNVQYISGSVQEMIDSIQDKGFDRALLIGGGITNALFLAQGAIDEMIFTIHPLILGSGIRVFESKSVDVKLMLVSQTVLDEGLVRVRYKTTQ